VNASLVLKTVIPVETDADCSFFVSALLGTSSLYLGASPLQAGGRLVAFVEAVSFEIFKS